MIYFVQAVDGGPIKIGTTIRLSLRLKQLCLEAENSFRVLAVLPGDQIEEQRLHHKFAHLRVMKEWFEPADDLLEFITHVATPWDGADDSPEQQMAKIDATIMRRARAVASIRGQRISDFLDELLKPAVDSAYKTTFGVDPDSDAPRPKSKPR